MVVDGNWDEQLACSASSFYARASGKILASLQWLQTGGRAGPKPVKFRSKTEEGHKASKLCILISEASAHKHDKIMQGIRNFEALSFVNALYNFHVFEDVPTMRAEINARTVFRFRWIVTRSEVTATRAALSAHLSVAPTHRWISNSVVTMGEFCCTLGKVATPS